MRARVGVVLLSGGLDSTVALWWAKEKEDYKEVHALTFLYGSREERVARKVCEKLASLAKVEKQIFLELPWLKEFSIKTESTLMEEGSGPPKVSINMFKDKESIKETSRSVWVPARNLCFASIATAYAEAIGGEVEIITGFNKEEAETFPDNSLTFVERMNALLEVSTLKAKVTLRSPLIHLDKKEICVLAEALSVPIEYSNSCYNPAGFTDDRKPIHCGVCESCTRRKRAFLEARGFDPTVYA
ncbi:MAG: 7-cyano-7-deazaguanine synthase QueC [Candidatus Freyarchaeota archaeon]|nr:7-cyano-7-deazaguanine synthase QueC [Candidatus Jordarchaeia archaeon]